MGRLPGLRFGVTLLTAALAVTFLCAAIVAAGHWTPGSEKLITHDAYNWAFTVHGAPMLVLVPGVVLFLSEIEEPPLVGRLPWLATAAWTALAVEALAIVASLAWWAGDGQLSPSRWVELVALPPCATVAAAVIARLRAPVRARDVALAFASVTQVGGFARLFPLDRALDATALAAVVVALGPGSRPRGPLLPVTALALTTLVPRESLAQLPASLIAIPCAMWLFVVALRRREVPRDMGEASFTALASLTLLESISLEQLLHAMGVDVHLHDTYFVVGAFHLQVTTCLLAALAVAHRRHPTVDPKWPMHVTVLLSASGSQVMGLAMLIVGSRGMPRRYYNYLPEFQPLHRAIAVGGCLLMLGVTLAVLGFTRRAARSK